MPQRQGFNGEWKDVLDQPYDPNDGGGQDGGQSQMQLDQIMRQLGAQPSSGSVGGADIGAHISIADILGLLTHTGV